MRAGPEQIPALTGLRFGAAFAVLLFHFTWIIPYPPLLGPLVNHGLLGVDLFFVLSGFVITYSYGDAVAEGRTSYRDFLQARFARIIPMHVLALGLLTPVVLVGLSIAAPGFSMSATAIIGSWLATLFLLFPLAPNAGDAIWNVPAWSLSAEMLFYLLFPLLVRLGALRMRRRSTILTSGAAVLLGYLAALQLLPGLDAYFFPLLRLHEFLIGCLAARYHLTQPRDTSSTGPNRALLGAGFGIVLLMLLTDGWHPVLTLLYASLAAVLVVAIARGANPVAQSLAHPIAVKLGEASYALYLLQFTPLSLLALVGRHFYAGGPMPWLEAIARQYPGAGVPAIVSLLVIALTIGASLLAYHFVECPARRALRPKPRGLENPRQRALLRAQR